MPVGGALRAGQLTRPAEPRLRTTAMDGGSRRSCGFRGGADRRCCAFLDRDDPLRAVLRGRRCWRLRSGRRYDRSDRGALCQTPKEALGYMPAQAAITFILRFVEPLIGGRLVREVGVSRRV